MEPLVRARTLLGFPDAVRRLGGDADEVLAMAGLSADKSAISDTWISFRAVLAAYEYAAENTGCKTFGLELSVARDLSYLGPLLLILKYSDDLKSGLVSASKFISIQNTGYQVALETTSRDARWMFSMANEMRSMASQWQEESMLTALKCIRIFLGDSYLPKGILFRHRPIGDIADYERFFGIPVEFSAQHDALAIHREALDTANPIGDHDMFQFLSGYLENRVLRPGEDLAGAVQSLLRKLIPTGKYSIDIVADQLSLHRRTLQRRLKQSGVNYGELLDQCRSEMAKDFLRTSNLPMVNLAHMLGYADQSAFNHAFRRLHGQTPLEWRRKQLDQ